MNVLFVFHSLPLPDTLWTPGPLWGYQIRPSVSRVIKSDKAPLEWSRCPTHSGPSAPNGAKIIFLSIVHLYFYECINCISFSPIGRHTLDPRPLIGLSNQTKRLSIEWSNQTKRLSSDRDAWHTLDPRPLMEQEKYFYQLFIYISMNVLIVFHSLPLADTLWTPGP